MNDKVLDEFELCPYTNGKLFSFKAISPGSYKAYEDQVEKGIKEETPVSIGMHNNTENSFKISYAASLFEFLLDILPNDSAGDDDEMDDEVKQGGGTNIVDEKIQ
jgi:hypothetical protein